MATTRYFKATDGVVTVFRASKTRIYQSAWFTRHDGETWPAGESGFSGKAAGAGGGQFPATQIEKAEFDRLVAAKNRRLGDTRYVSPSDSWVCNADVAEG